MGDAGRVAPGATPGVITPHLDSAGVAAQPLIAPSLLSADFARPAEEAHHVADADWPHVDVTDDRFVPNLTPGRPVVQAIQEAGPVPLACHLMIEAPERWAPGYAEADADGFVAGSAVYGADDPAKAIAAQRAQATAAGRG